MNPAVRVVLATGRALFLGKITEICADLVTVIAKHVAGATQTNVPHATLLKN